MQRTRWLALAAVFLMLVPATLATSAVAPLPAAPPQAECCPDPGEEPDAYLWRTWVLSSSSELRPGFPPELLSLDGAEELVALKRAQLERTEAQVEAAEFWDTGPATQRWTELALDMISAFGPNPPRVARFLSLLHIAMYDAVVASWEAKHFYNRSPPSALDPTLSPAFAPRNNPSYPSEHAAVAGAASRILQYAWGAQKGFEFFEMKADEAAMSRVWAGVNWPSDVEAGMALGHMVADKVLARAAADGSSRAWDGMMPSGDCVWHPTPPGNIFPPLEPMWGKVKPWLMTSGSQFRAPPPPECGSEEWFDQNRDVWQAVVNIRPEEREIAEYWADGPNTVTPPGHWNLIALEALAKHPLSTPRAARAFAYLGAVVHDAGVGVWDTKYTYWVERPIEVIREEGWDPMFSTIVTTPPFPGYVSGHSGFSGGAARWLGHVWPEEKVSFRAMAFEAVMSRFYGGIHIMADNLEGMYLGQSIADLAIERAMDDGAE